MGQKKGCMEGGGYVKTKERSVGLGEVVISSTFALL